MWVRKGGASLFDTQMNLLFKKKRDFWAKKSLMGAAGAPHRPTMYAEGRPHLIPPPFGRAAAVYLTSVSIFFRGIMVPQVLSGLEFIGWFWSSMACLSDLNLASCNAACTFLTRNHTWMGLGTLPYTSLYSN